jgi:hypothetical protein
LFIRIQKILGFNHKELTGKSLFNFFHALDLPELEKFFKTCKSLNVLSLNDCKNVVNSDERILQLYESKNKLLLKLFKLNNET